MEQRSLLKGMIVYSAAEAVLPKGWQQRDTPAPIHGLQVEGLLPARIPDTAAGLRYRLG